MQENGNQQTSAFGDLLRAHRQGALLSQQDLASRAGVSDRSIRNLETARVRVPNVSTARLLAEALQLSGQSLDAFIAAAVGRPAEGNEPAEPVRPAQLPMAARHFVGRQTEIAILDEALDQLPQALTTTVLLLAGGAGVGKTSLAVDWAHRAGRHFPDGVLYADLGRYASVDVATSVGTLVSGFLDSLGSTARGRPDTVEAQSALYRSVTAGRRLLLIIDNALHADHVRPLIPASAGCIAVVISRAPLHSLVVREGAQLIRVGLLDARDARELLSARLGRTRIEAEPAAVTDIIRACGHLPLALAVVAARAACYESLPLAAVAAELTSAPALMPSDGSDPADDFRAVLSWSYQTLDPDAAATFRAAALHPAATIDRSAAAALVDLPPDRARAALASLERAGLATQEDPGRYTIHDLVKRYAQELGERYDSDARRRAAVVRLAAAVSDRAEIAAAQFDGLRATTDQDQHGVTTAEAASAWFAREWPTLTALASAALQAGDDRTCWKLARDVGRFLRRQGLCAEQLQTQTMALAAAERLADPGCLAVTCRYLATTHHALGRPEQSRTFLGRAMSYALAADDAAVLGAVYLDAGVLAAAEQDYRGALEYAELAHSSYTEAGDLIGAGRALNAMGWDHLRLHAPEQAIELCGRAARILRDAGDAAGTAATLDSLGEAHAQLGAPDKAMSYYEQALAMFRDLRAPLFEAEALMRIGDLQHEHGDAEAARASWRRAIDALDEAVHAASPVAAELRNRMPDCELRR